MAVAVLALLTTFKSNGRVQAEEVEAMRILAARQLDKALQVSESAGDPAEQIAILKAAASETRREVVKCVGPRGSRTFRATEVKCRWQYLQGVACGGYRRDILRFEPLVEAPLPDGFPTPTPVGDPSPTLSEVSAGLY